MISFDNTFTLELFIQEYATDSVKKEIAKIMNVTNNLKEIKFNVNNIQMSSLYEQIYINGQNKTGGDKLTQLHYLIDDDNYTFAHTSQNSLQSI